MARHHLNDHPFYRAWRAGTLPRAALSAYAADYAPFIAAVEAGWRTLGEDAHAAEEREHARLWVRFRDALGVPEEAARRPNPQAAALTAHAERLFAEPVTALGALYAFEAQQPSTARSKLDGLCERYGLSEDAAAYFRAHADDYGERDRLAARAEALSRMDLAIARQACEQACLAMWAVLDGAMGDAAEACAMGPA
ncbi:MAG TPA: iron-containing redox enzyme family protein [Polyangiaceae bacterium]|nr:iron-containing redox enzyme family protein [Polyangiaceae bacterium]